MKNKLTKKEKLEALDILYDHFEDLGGVKLFK